MARYAVIENGQVVNVVLGDDTYLGGIKLPEGVQASKGWGYIDGVFVKPEIPAIEEPEFFGTLSRPAFMFMAKKLGMTKQSMLDLVAATMTGDQRDIAEAVIEDQQTFHRDNQLLKSLVASAPDLTSAMVDAAWRTAEQIKW